MCGSSMRGNREALQTPGLDSSAGRSKKANGRNFDMHVCGELISGTKSRVLSMRQDLFLLGLHFTKSLAKIGFQLVVSYLSAKRIEEFCKPRLRKFFHGLAEAPHVMTDNEGCYAPHDVGELTELSGHAAKSVLRHGFPSGFRYDGRSSGNFFYPVRLGF